jgi:hypothetical protein
MASDIKWHPKAVGHPLKSVEIQRTLTALSRLCETRGKHVLVYSKAPLDNGYSRAIRSKHSSEGLFAVSNHRTASDLNVTGMAFDCLEWHFCQNIH